LPEYRLVPIFGPDDRERRADTRANRSTGGTVSPFREFEFDAVDDAVVAGKILAADRALWRSALKKDPAGTSRMLEARAPSADVARANAAVPAKSYTGDPVERATR
jgi:hypothetical protein